MLHFKRDSKRLGLLKSKVYFLSTTKVNAKLIFRVLLSPIGSFETVRTLIYFLSKSILLKLGPDEKFNHEEVAQSINVRNLFIWL